MLNLRVPLAPFETPASFLSRLAKRNGCSYARDLCRNLGVDFQGVIDARPGTLNQLAELGGVDANAMHRHAVRRVATKAYAIGAEPIGPTAVRRETLRFCPACLLNDIEAAGDRRDSAPAGRSMWQVRSIRTCHTHGLPLVDMPCPSYRLRNDFVFGLEAIPGFSGLLVERAKVPARSPGGLESYLHARLFGAGRGDTWLDTIEITAVARAAEIFGAVARHGVDVAVATLSEDQLQESGELGFDILRGGQASITAFLRTMQDARALAGAAGAQAVFGQIYRWLASSTEEALAPIRKVVRQHIVETMSFAPGDVVLGEPVLQQRVYSVYSASRQFGVHPKTLRKFLVGSGLIEDDGKIADAHATFEANEGERLIAQLKRGISEKPLQSYLNVPRPALRTLIADGLLKPMTVGKGMNDLFDTDEVDRFFTELAANAVECLLLPTGSWDISSAAGRANCSIVEVVRLIQTGGLKQVARLTHVQGFMSIAVDLEEVRAAVRLPALPGLVPTDISDYFGMTDAASKALVDHGILESVVGKNPINRGPQRYVPWPAIEAFYTRYISLRDLGKLRGVNSRRLLRELGETGIRPEPHLLGLGAYMFDRASVT